MSSASCSALQASPHRLRLPHTDATAQTGDAARFTAAPRHLRRSKLWLAALFGILFWFSVPYSLPRHLPSANATTQSTDNAEQFEGAMSRQIAVPVLGLCACFMLWRFPRRGVLYGRLLIVICLYLTWVVSSTLWSEDPALTGKRLVVFLLDCLFTYALARTVSTLEMALGALIPMFATGVLSVFADIFLLHNFNPADADYRLQGVMSPNHQAMNLVSCCLCCAAVMLRRPRWVPRLTPVLLITLAMLWITRARIGTILCFGLLAVAGHKMLRDRVRPEVRTAIVLVALLLVGPPLLFVLGNDAGGTAQKAFMMGRNDSENTGNLSNRLPLWQELMTSVEQRPILGYGYGAFWTTERAARISKDQGWPVPHAHNTYLDQVIALGVVGGALYLTVMLSALGVAWLRYRRVPSSGNLLNAMLLTWLVLLNTSESAPLEPHMPTIMVYAAVLRMCLREGSVDTADPDLRTGPDPDIVIALDPAGSSLAATSAVASPPRRPPPAREPASKPVVAPGQWRIPVLPTTRRRYA